MKNILHIISSPRADQSYSKGLSSAIIDRLSQSNNIHKIVVRDLIKEVPPLADEVSIHEFYKHPGMYDERSNQLLSYANMIVEEVKEADVIVIGTPMYNFGISASLKTWLDQLIRAGITYTFDEQGNRIGQFKNKKVYLAIASGGRKTEGNPDYLAAYLKDVLKTYAGITNVKAYWVEGTVENGFKANYDQVLNDFTSDNES
ncbi:FMN-dependent NADH-azoreductase [Chryseobacterium sp. PMSZPI]|uniref:FMN-dependent NADH-azoreductase n=1 Tax=Chryseobacterium sp. PMSZPI TaxID=1033900 RepID=UPI000C34B9D1|nr:NAD(P)H-dependent oxidoreductase [Chryseobacterium sp. PMSZPI]PKF73695.1 FMN-dependent NADH-azoreductase [Chryseobacterium sp. PMSZPI]